MRGLLDRKQATALLFGRESTGLTNAELDRCHYHTQIPVDPAFSSMNLGSAVSVLLYELRRQALASDEPKVDLGLLASRSDLAEELDELSTAADMRHFYEHLQTVLDKAEPGHAGSASRMRVLTRIFNRAPMLAAEVRLLRGVLRSIEAKLDSGA